MTVPINERTSNPPHQNTFNVAHSHYHEPNAQTKTVAGYTLQQKLGFGSFATVYKAVRIQPTTSHDASNDHTDDHDEDPVVETTRDDGDTDITLHSLHPDDDLLLSRRNASTRPLWNS